MWSNVRSRFEPRTAGAIQEEDVYCDLYLNYYLYAGQAYRGCSAYYDDYLGGYYGYFEGSSNGLINDYNETLGEYEGYSAYVEVEIDSFMVVDLHF